MTEQSLLVGLATEEKQDAVLTALALLGTDAKLELVRALLAGTLAVSGPLTNAQLAAQGLATQTTLAAVLAAVQAATPAGENHVGEVGGNTAIATQSFSRPANTTAYATGDLVANSATAGSVGALSLAAARKVAGTGRVLRARLSKSSVSLTNASFRVHLFKTTPTTTAGDNVAFAAAVAGVASGYLGHVDITMDRAFSDGAKGLGAPDIGACISFQAAGGSTAIFGLVEALAAYTPASGETFTLELEVDRD